MNITIDKLNPGGFYNIEKAYKVAAALQESDPEWTYTVTEVCGGKMGRIDVRDEDGYLLQEGLLVD